MQTKKLFLKDFLFILPASLVLGAGLASLQAGAWWIGWLGFSALFIVGLIALVIAWRWGEGGKTLAWMIGLALLLRLAAGVAVYIALPINGHNSADDKAGYVFTDAHRRDDQAWDLPVPTSRCGRRSIKAITPINMAACWLSAPSRIVISRRMRIVRC